jgi:hypothetical protein
MRTYYDDNFGCYEIRDQDDVDFYHQMQRQSVRKKCQGCGRMQTGVGPSTGSPPQS